KYTTTCTNSGSVANGVGCLHKIQLTRIICSVFSSTMMAPVMSRESAYGMEAHWFIWRTIPITMTLVMTSMESQLSPHEETHLRCPVKPTRVPADGEWISGN